MRPGEACRLQDPRIAGGGACPHKHAMRLILWCERAAVAGFAGARGAQPRFTRNERVWMKNHDRFMHLAYQEALKALDEGEVPVGAVIVKDGRILGRGYNRIEGLQDATAHAEIVAIGAASSSLGTWRLDGCTLYVTLEPCLMCLGAILQARLETVVYGANDPRLGALSSHPVSGAMAEAYGRFPGVDSGIMADQSLKLLQSFFERLRKKS
jgi:tRNA(adenine34) deaminase